MKENYGDGVSDRIAKPRRSKDCALVNDNMQVKDMTNHYHYYATNLQNPHVFPQ